MSGGHLSAETIDLMMLASLPSTEVDHAKAHLGSCERCRVRWQELEDDKRRFEQFVLPRTLEKVQQRARPGSLWDRLRERWSFAVPALGLVTAALIAVVLLPKTSPEAPPPYVGIKGGPTLKVVGSRGDTQFQVGPGDRLQPGDRIRFVVSPAEARYVLIASVDQGGVVSVFYPYDGAKSAALEGAASQELPGSIELDATLGKEQLFAVFSAEPLDAARVREALKAGQLASAVGGAEVVTLTFDKVSP